MYWKELLRNSVGYHYPDYYLPSSSVLSGKGRYIALTSLMTTSFYIPYNSQIINDPIS